MTLWAAPVLSALTKSVLRRTSSAPGWHGNAAPRIIQADRQSAASMGCLFSQWSGTSTVKPTISCVGCVEMGRNPENEGTPMQHLFLEIPRNAPLHHPSLQETGLSQGQTALQRSTGRRGGKA
jgi:hypothetical protein